MKPPIFRGENADTKVEIVTKTQPTMMATLRPQQWEMAA
jgi:hypothetical protein